MFQPFSLVDNVFENQSKVAEGFKNQTLQHCSAVGRAGQVRGQENESPGLNFLSAELVKQKAELKVGSEVQGGDKRGDKPFAGTAEAQKGWSRGGDKRGTSHTSAD